TWQRATRIETQVIPTYEVERMEPPTAVDIPLLGAAVFDMKQLAETEMGRFEAALKPLTEAYEAWIEAQEAQLSTPSSDLAVYQTSATAAIANCREALTRVQA